MPLYSWSAQTTTQQAFSNATTATVEVDEPVITDGLLFITADSYLEVRAEILFGDRRILPNAGGEPELVPGKTGFSPINVQLPGVPNQLTLRVWAPDADFQHTVVAQAKAVTEENASQAVRFVGGEDDPVARPARTATGGQDLTPEADD